MSASRSALQPALLVAGPCQLASEGVEKSFALQLAAWSRTLDRAVASALPVLAITSSPEFAEAASNLIAGKDVHLVAAGRTGGATRLSNFIAAGVAASAAHAGWLVLPRPLPAIKPTSLRAVAAALSQHPIALAQHLGASGALVGFGAELYSELIRLSGADGVKRLVARYPSVAILLDDADICYPSIAVGAESANVKWSPSGSGGGLTRPWD